MIFVSDSEPLSGKTDRSDWKLVGARAKQIRDGFGDTQPQFVERLRAECRISTSTTEWSRIETGLAELPRHWMNRIAQIARPPVTSAWLAWGDDATESKKSPDKSPELRPMPLVSPPKKKKVVRRRLP